MAVRFEQRRGLQRRTFELEGARLLVSESGLLASRQVRVPAEVLFGDRDEVKTASWIPLAVMALYVVVTISALAGGDREDHIIITAPAIAVFAGAMFLWSRRRYR